MKYKPLRITLAMVAFLALALAAVVWADQAGEQDLDMSDPGGNYIIMEPGVSSVGDFSVAPGNVLTLGHSIRPPSMLARQDYQNVYDEAMTLLTNGQNFRYSIMPHTVYSYTEVISNYLHYNDGAEFYAFCSDYDNVDQQGYCPDESNIRNRLIRARELFAFLSLAEPVGTTIDQGDIRHLGRLGVVSATREIANVHLIFGNEFLADALDYRFSDTATNADSIIAEEIEQLEYALQQYKLAVDVLAHALNADFGGPWGAYIGDYFGSNEFDLFGIVSERMVMTLERLAHRYRILGQEGKAVRLYTEGAMEQYVQALAMANKAQERGVDFTEYGGGMLIANLSRLRAVSKAVQEGLTPFGFADVYVPLYPFDDPGGDSLLAFTRDPLLRDAREDEIEAREAQRFFDAHRDALQDELLQLDQTYGSQLLDLCGSDIDECEGGMMAQNYYNMMAADARIRLVRQQTNNIPRQIEIEEQRSGKTINLILENGRQMAAWDYTIALNSSCSESESESTTTTEGESESYGVSCGFSISAIPSFGCNASVSKSYSHSKSHTTSKSRSWNPYAPEIAHLTSLKTLRQSAERAQIENANSQATIRNLLLKQADLLIELDIAVAEFNRLSAEHNHLVERYQNLLALRKRAQQNLVDSYMNNPAYRILRESLTVEAERSLGLAAQFAYLTAKALEYEYLMPLPCYQSFGCFDDIFKARTGDDIDNYLTYLEALDVAWGSPGARNRFPYQISIARDLMGLSDENLDPEGEMTGSELAQLRYELFQEFLQQHTVSDTVEFYFTTSLSDTNLFSPNIWNNRIAGVSLPAGVPGTEGLSINILTRQFGDAGTPEIMLTHGGFATYRTANGQLVEYEPGPTALVGYKLPPGFQGKNTTAVLLCSVNGNGLGTPSSALFNRSVAASNWVLRIDLASSFNDNLDVSQIEDIEIRMDSTGIARQGRQMAAQMDSLQLRAEFDGVPLKLLLMEEMNAVPLEK